MPLAAAQSFFQKQLRLAQHPRFEVLIAGRHPAKADALIRRFDKLAQARCEAVRLDTNAAGFSADLRSLKPHIVIDTAGHVEPASVRSLQTSHPAFEDAALEAVLGSLFKPARLSGHPVRQLTRQSVRFVSAATPW